MDLIGQKFGKYELVEYLGHGGMAEVYKAHQPGLDRYVAIKLMHRHLARTGDFVSRFRREARSIGQLQHTHILHVIDFDVENDVYYLVMDFIQGESLKEYLEKEKKLSVDESLTLIMQMADAIEYAHQQGMIHRDIKPANIMFLDDSHQHTLLADFGMARLQNDSGLTATGAIVGTPAYMSPEATEGVQVDERADIYSLGVVLYEMVTGTTPYKGDTPLSVVVKQLSEPLPPPTQFNPDLPQAVEDVLLKALAKDPDERYQTATELKAALRGLQTQPPRVATTQHATEAAQPSLAPPAFAPPPAKKNLGLLVTGVVLLVGLIGVMLFVFLGGQPDSTASDNTATGATNPTATVAAVVAANPEPTATIAPTALPTTAPTPTAPIAEPTPAGPPPVGSLRFAHNDVTLTGDFVIQLNEIDPPRADQNYTLWLTDDSGDTVTSLVAALPVVNGRVEFAGSTNQTLLANYSRVVISLESAAAPPASISDEVVFTGLLPPEFLGPIRQVFITDDITGKGFATGALEQLDIAINHAGRAQAGLDDDNLKAAKQHAEHVFHILVGESHEFYGDLDQNGLPENPGDGFGVQPYVAQSLAQLALASAASPQASGVQAYHDRIQQTGSNINDLLDAASKKVLQVFASDTVEEAQRFVSELEVMLDQLLVGRDVDGNGAIDPTTNEGGLNNLYEDGLRLGAIDIFPANEP